MRRIIFLDIDGILNSDAFRKRKYAMIRSGKLPSEFPLSEYDPAAVTRLNDIVEATNCEVVLSTDWRFSKGIYDTLRKVGCNFTPIGITPCLGSYPIRGAEIGCWIVQNVLSSSDRYVIIDDDLHDGIFPSDKFVHVDSRVGLMPKDVDRVVGILNE